jgi:hypothetical protein
MAHEQHQDHEGHEHGPNCGHTPVNHNDHVDYLHDGHRHASHESHWDEHIASTMAARSDSGSAGSTFAEGPADMPSGPGDVGGD